ncbi:hypothetical protein PTSG_08057 [Salpingoeca rosetta]|uniref:Protrudin n=1 Tax=Salpingoeca rosetta (strain ATCC 50818 / BSB-021) TaxID=946362 RepID=F2UHV7_SALR5|nr:uncharacterized protein PTSG_08057 [Salpingoeca rosetta]EGD76706.1 hypothetical protein PTSG_08057 [Salpingoeca rosetta]|eukprot:XP_004991078.1 hypothetical protein PTSG_08057 [Salpingoeca rosetta]
MMTQRRTSGAGSVTGTSSAAAAAAAGAADRTGTGQRRRDTVVGTHDDSGGRGGDGPERGTDSDKDQNTDVDEHANQVQRPQVDIGLMADAFDRLVLELHPFIRIGSAIRYILSWENPKATLVVLAVCLLCSFLPLLVPFFVASSMLACLWYRYYMRGDVSAILFDADLVKAVDSYTRALPKMSQEAAMQRKLNRFHHILLMLQSSMLAAMKLLISIRTLLFWKHPTITLWFIGNIIGVAAAVLVMPKEYVFAFMVVSVFAAETHLGRACRSFYIPALPPVDLAEEAAEVRPLVEQDEANREKISKHLHEMQAELNAGALEDSSSQRGGGGGTDRLSTAGGDNDDDEDGDGDDGDEDGGSVAGNGSGSTTGAPLSDQTRRTMAALGSSHLQQRCATPDSVSVYNDGGFVWVDVDKHHHQRASVAHSTPVSTSSLDPPLSRRVPASTSALRRRSGASAPPPRAAAQPRSSSSSLSASVHARRTAAAAAQHHHHACAQCGSAFNIMRSKYDCNSCGSPICSRCAVKVKRSALGTVGNAAASTVRVCGPCAETLRVRAEGLRPNEHDIVLGSDTHT